jgi:hypothetical protein
MVHSATTKLNSVSLVFFSLVLKDLSERSTRLELCGNLVFDAVKLGAD